MGGSLLALLVGNVLLVAGTVGILAAMSVAVGELLSGGGTWTPAGGDVVPTVVDAVSWLLLPGLVVLVLAEVWYAFGVVGRGRGFGARASEDPDLAARTRRLAQQADVATPAVRVVDSAVANSFTVGRSGNATVYVTSALRERLPAGELDAVLAHELAHVKNGDVTVITLATGVVYFGEIVVGLALAGFLLGLGGWFVLWVALTALSWGAGAVSGLLPGALLAGIPGVALASTAATVAGFAVAVLVMVGLATSAALFFGLSPLVFGLIPVARRFSWTREYAADAAAAEIVGGHAALASALRRLSDATGTPERDLRTAWTRSRPMCVVSFPGDGDAAEDGDAAAPDDPLRGAHPPVEKRIERLRALAE